ncbi:PEP-CTERM protein-sorting domain-containing protein [Candidatus Fervidibacteria bacterium JGI MDM2 SSWTFF-3-K9]
MKLGRRWLITVIALSLLPFMFINLTHAAPLQPGQIFVAYGGNQIGVFADTVSLTGNVIQTLEVPSPGFLTVTTLGGGGGLALDEEGNLYATLSDNNGNVGLVKFRASDGERAFEKTYTISGVEDFRSLVVRGGRIYVATNRGIRVFDATNGDYLTSFGGTLAFRDLAFDSQGNLYALREPTTGNAEIRRWAAGDFTGTGTILFSASGNRDPRALVVDEQGNIYFTANPAGGGVVRKFRQDGTLLATYSVPSGTGTLIGLDYDPGTQRLFASHTATGGIGQILWIDRNAASGSTMSAFGPNNLNGVRWLAVYPTPEPATAVLLIAGLGWLVRRVRRKA